MLSTLKQSIQLYFDKQNLIKTVKVILPLSLINFAISLGLSFLPQDSWFVQIPSLIILAVVTFFITTVSYILILEADNLDVLGIYKKSLAVFFYLYLLVILVSGLSFVGFLFLIVPGIIFAVWFSQTIFVFLDKGYFIKSAFVESRKLVQGRFWFVLLRLLVFGIFSGFVTVVLSSIPFMGAFFVDLATPLTLLPFYLFYRQLTSSISLK